MKKIKFPFTARGTDLSQLLEKSNKPFILYNNQSNHLGIYCTY